jgi:hypothetical protein
VSAAEALCMAQAAGLRIEVDGSDLVLEAPAPPPATVLDALSRHKADVVLLLRPAADGWSPADWQAYFDERAGIAEFEGGLARDAAEARAFECCVCEWLNRNPAPLRPGRCAWCGKAESGAATILPFGLEPSGHTWLHDDCWADWHQRRREQAIAVLSAIGIKAPAKSERVGGA